MQANTTTLFYRKLQHLIAGKPAETFLITPGDTHDLVGARGLIGMVRQGKTTNQIIVVRKHDPPVRSSIESPLVAANPRRIARTTLLPSL